MPLNMTRWILSALLISYFSIPGHCAAPDPHRARSMEARTQSQASETNLKQISLALLEYLQDHNATYPDARHWMDQIKNYLPSQSLLRDSAAPVGEKYSYAFNSNLSGKSQMLMKDPAATVVLFECGSNKRNMSGSAVSARRKPGRYMGGTSYGFSDGRVRWILDTKPAPLFKYESTPTRDFSTLGALFFLGNRRAA